MRMEAIVNQGTYAQMKDSLALEDGIQFLQSALRVEASLLLVHGVPDTLRMFLVAAW